MRLDGEKMLAGAGPVELCTLAGIGAGGRRLDPQDVNMAWNGVQLAPSRGTQKEWTTSRLVIRTSTGRPAGMCSTPSVTRPGASG